MRSRSALRGGLRTGLRWKLSAAIALVGALVALALSLVVHNAARVSMLDNARDLADERIQVAQRMYESGRQQNPGAFGVEVDDPTIPGDLLADGPRRFRTGSSDRAGQGHGLGLTIAADQARVLGARLTFRNVRPAGAPEDVPAEGAVAVLWLPEHAPTNTGSHPMLPLPRSAGS